MNWLFQLSVLLGALLVWPAAATVARGQDEPPLRQAQFERRIRPFLAKYCFDCHSDETAEGGLALDGFAKAAEIATTRRSAWQNVHDQLAGHVMPPEEAPQPNAAERKEIADWLRAALEECDCSGPVNPGHETIRRLTRFEYKNTIRDLLRVEAKLADDFPADDVGYGFDNIGDVLTLSPLLLEKYLASARSIAQAAIVTEPTDSFKTERYPAARMLVTARTERLADGGRLIKHNGGLMQKIRPPLAGEYAIRVRAWGQQAGAEPARMRLKLNYRRLADFDVRAEEKNPATYSHRLKLKESEPTLEILFLNDQYLSDPDPRRRDRNLAVMYAELVGPLDERGREYPESHGRIFFVRPGGELSEDEAARKILFRLATRAFRRPATAEEVDRLLRIAQAKQKRGGSFEQGIQLALQAILVSPHFLFKAERDPAPDDPDGIRDLDEFELATRLSYFLWSSTPDDRLLTMAHRSNLRANLEQQVRRMLADERADALVKNFSRQWLQLQDVQHVVRDHERFPQFDEQLRDDMVKETELFFGTIVREDRSVLELLDADFTYLNERLARLYGVEGVRGEQFRRVSLNDTPRGGVLTLASVLTVTSHPTRTSPVKRGKWILETILGTPPPPPPDNVPDLEETVRANPRLSLREQLEIHRRDARCRACHQQMDPLGLGLENFNAVGAWRDRDGDEEIDPTGVLPDGQKFAGPAQLKRLLTTSRKDEFLRCLSERMLTYALGRGVEHYDRCTVNEIVAAVARDDYRFSRLILEIASSDAFQKRSRPMMKAEK